MKHFLLSLTAVLFLISCSAAETPTPTITKTAVFHPSPVPTSTVPPPTATQTAVPIPTVSAMPKMPISTPVPTLVPKKAVSRVMDLLHDTHNSNCLLPCWWGVVPGETYWHSVAPYLQSFAIEIRSYPEESLFVVAFPVLEDVKYTKELNMGYRIDTSGVITSMSIASINIDGYDPQTMMSLYGVPDEVWVNTVPFILQDDVLPFSLFIVYQEQGMSFHYYVDASIAEKTVTACFKQGVVEADRPDLFPAGPRMFLWEPGQFKSIDEIHKASGDRPSLLEEKTDMTPQTFYDKFTDPDEMPCIDTPSVLWD